MPIYSMGTGMGDASTKRVTRCFGCGFEAPDGSDAWATVNHPPLGTLTQCPECGSTDIRGRG